MKKLKVLDLFSGIGGFSLGLERTGGFETVAFCEIEPYPRAVLKRHWPQVPCYDDVRTLTADTLRGDGIAVDVICGGFPCQDISNAGARAGMGGERSGLWSEIIRLVGELRPRFVLVENVAALLSGPTEQPGGWFGRVLGDLATLGYDAEWHCIPASAFGADHIRDRVWIIAYTDTGLPRHEQVRWAGGASICDAPPAHLDQTRKLQPQGRVSNKRRRSGDSPKSLAANAHVARRERGSAAGENNGHAPRFASWMRDRIHDANDFSGDHWDHQPVLGRGVHGVPYRVDRIGCLGNAVVPQIPELIGHAILHAEGLTP